MRIKFDVWWLKHVDKQNIKGSYGFNYTCNDTNRKDFYSKCIKNLVGKILTKCSYIHTYVHTYICTYVHTHIHTHTYTYTHIHYIHTLHTYTHIHTYTHTHIHTHTHTHIHTYIHTCTCWTYCISVVINKWSKISTTKNSHHTTIN